MTNVFSPASSLALFLTFVIISATQAKVSSCTEEELSRLSIGLTKDQADRAEHLEVTTFNGRRLLRMNKIIDAVLENLQDKTQYQAQLKDIQALHAKVRYPEVMAWEDPRVIADKIEKTAAILLAILTADQELSNLTSSLQTDISGYIKSLRNAKYWVADICERTIDLHWRK